MMESYTLALDVHAELQQQGCSMKAAGWLESAYREELEQELEKQFGGIWDIKNEIIFLPKSRKIFFMN